MNRFLSLLILIVAALGLSSVALAQEDPKDNACYAGGAWEGKCDWPTDAEDEWAWTCGWHYARVIDGRTSAAEAPATCKFITEDDSTDPVDPVEPEVCAPQNDFYSYIYIDSRVVSVPAPGVLVNDGSCKLAPAASAPAVSLDPADFVIGSSFNLGSVSLFTDGSFLVEFSGDVGFVTLTYQTTDGQSADLFVELTDFIIEPVECVMEADNSICIEGDSYTYTRYSTDWTSVGNFDAHPTFASCQTTIQGIVGSDWQYTIFVHGTLESYFPTTLAGDARVICAYIID